MITKSAEETREFGKKLAKYLRPKDVIALFGELGSGKTTLTKGIAQGLGVKNADYVNSPSFVLIKEYKAKINLYHMDLYRLDKIENIEALGLQEYLYSGGVCVIEWAEKIEDVLPDEYLGIKINITRGNLREIQLNPHSERYEHIVRRYIHQSNQRSIAG